MQLHKQTNKPTLYKDIRVCSQHYSCYLLLGGVYIQFWLI